MSYKTIKQIVLFVILVCGTSTLTLACLSQLPQALQEKHPELVRDTCVYQHQKHANSHTKPASRNPSLLPNK